MTGSGIAAKKAASLGKKASRIIRIPQGMAIKRLVAELERAIGKPAILDKKPMQPGDVERTYADLTRSRTELGYEPKVSLAEGLRRFVAWFKEYGHLYKLPGEA